MLSTATLGLDLGTNSIGWALVRFDENQQPFELIDCGVRIFQEAVEAKTRAPKNLARRKARGARKLVARRRMRREALAKLLSDNGMLDPKLFFEWNEQAVNDLGDPYSLRMRGLDEKLSLVEFGRVLMQLCKHRGFQSNRKSKGDDDGVVKKSISELYQKMKQKGVRTLGEYLVAEPTKRGRYTHREMYKDEFEQLWAAQATHHSSTLTATLKVKIHNTIFFQRPLKLQKHLIGKCPFEPDRKRAPRALLEAQRARLWQDLNNLEVKNPITRAYRKLDTSEKSKLAALLEKQKTVSWGKAKKTLGLHENELFNLEEGKKSELIGNRTAYAMRDAMNDAWDAMPIDKQRELITDILTIDNDAGFLRRMREHWKFDEKIAQALAQTELEPGNGRLSSKALHKILPELQKGFRYDEACKEAGYNHSKPTQTKVLPKLDEPPMLRNPVVQKALYETRRVVNAIIKKYGAIDVIRVEMARDMKLSAKQKEAAQKQNKANEKLNKEATEIAAEHGIQHAKRDDRLRYRLWKECALTCVYTGKTISQEMLFSGEVDIEHIIPYSLCLDDSYMNKTLCMSEENRKVKKNKTPFEAYSGNENNYLQILARTKDLPHSKRRKFEQKDVKTDDFVSRQLNDTRYICVEVKNYLTRLGRPVEVSKGAATSDLRWHWGMDLLLNTDGEYKKNRADHRHHAVDAIVIALTTRSLFMKLSHKFDVGYLLPRPWASFDKDIRAKVDAIIVSHAATRKIYGALHEATAYGAGFIWNKNKKGESVEESIFTYRKPLDDKFTEKHAASIRDERVKEIVLARLAEFDGDSKKAFGNSDYPLLHEDGKTPIHSVRVVTRMNPATVHGIKDKSGKPYKFVSYGNNHHVEIIEHVETGKRRGVFVTAMEAARRVRIAKLAVTQKDHGTDWKFVMSLSINDSVRLNDQIWRVQMLSGGEQFVIALKGNRDTLSEYNAHSKWLKSEGATSNIQAKVSIDALGCIATCND